MKTIALRLLPDQDFMQELCSLAHSRNLDAGVILSAVGSLKEAALRFADQTEATVLAGPLEIVSVTGVVARAGNHVHISVSDKTGKTSGGHLMEGCKIYTTIELVLLDLSADYMFERSLCRISKFDELLVKPAIQEGL